MKKLLIFLLVIGGITSCSCDPEDIAKIAFSGMETLMGEGFMPSEEIRALGKFESMSINLSQSNVDGEVESVIFLRLENGDPRILGNQPEVLARKCAQIYLSDFKKSIDYQKITVQFIQTDPSNPQNMAMQEYTFDVIDFSS
jgi:hypothetical protein